MTEFFTEYNGIYGEGLVYIQYIFPIDGFDLIINFVGILGFKIFDGLQNADGGAQAKVRFVHHLFISGEWDHSSTYLYVIGS